MQVAKYWRTKNLRYRLVRATRQNESRRVEYREPPRAEAAPKLPIKRKLAEIAS